MRTRITWLRVALCDGVVENFREIGIAGAAGFEIAGRSAGRSTKFRKKFVDMARFGSLHTTVPYPTSMGCRPPLFASRRRVVEIELWTRRLEELGGAVGLLMSRESSRVSGGNCRVSGDYLSVCQSRSHGFALPLHPLPRSGNTQCGEVRRRPERSGSVTSAPFRGPSKSAGMALFLLLRCVLQLYQQRDRSFWSLCCP